MRRILFSLILLAAVACKADHASRVSSAFDENVGTTPGTTAKTPSSELQPSAPARPAVVSSRPVIVCFGDSLTAGYGADDGASYPDYLQKELDKAGYSYRIVNEGVSGNTTKDGVDRLNTILTLQPALVVLEFGGNDGLRGFKVQTTKSNLAFMIVALQKARIPVVLAGITLPPDYGADYIQSFNRNYVDLARQYKLPLLPFLLKDVYGVQGMMQADNTHATDAGNEVVARNVLPYVEPLLHK